MTQLPFHLFPATRAMFDRVIQAEPSRKDRLEHVMRYLAVQAMRSK